MIGTDLERSRLPSAVAFEETESKRDATYV
jgi:hypothetical protein